MGRAVSEKFLNDLLEALQDRRSNENFIFKPAKVPGLRHTFGSGAFSLPQG